MHNRNSSEDFGITPTVDSGATASQSAAKCDPPSKIRIFIPIHVQALPPYSFNLPFVYGDEAPNHFASKYRFMDKTNFDFEWLAGKLTYMFHETSYQVGLDMNEVADIVKQHSYDKYAIGIYAIEIELDSTCIAKRQTESEFWGSQVVSARSYKKFMWVNKFATVNAKDIISVRRHESFFEDSQNMQDCFDSLQVDDVKRCVDNQSENDRYLAALQSLTDTINQIENADLKIRANRARTAIKDLACSVPLSALIPQIKATIKVLTADNEKAKQEAVRELEAMARKNIQKKNADNTSKKWVALGIALMALGAIVAAIGVAAIVGSFGIAAPIGIGLAAGGATLFGVGAVMTAYNVHKIRTPAN